jgi:hypothetical protein
VLADGGWGGGVEPFPTSGFFKLSFIGAHLKKEGVCMDMS